MHGATPLDLVILRLSTDLSFLLAETSFLPITTSDVHPCPSSRVSYISLLNLAVYLRCRDLGEQESNRAASLLIRTVGV